MDKLDPQALRAAFGSFMTGVTIVTARAEDGTPAGFTANSFTSVSLDPPLLLVCPGYHLSRFEVFRRCPHFAVNVLREDQQDISNTFASSSGDRFANTCWTADSHGVPLIVGALATFSCSIHDRVEAGDHMILMGRVERFENSEGLGLGYWRGGYFSLARERQAQTIASENRHVAAGAIVDREGEVFVIERDGKLALPSFDLPNRTQARAGMNEHLKSLGLEAELGRVYSIYHDARGDKRYIYFRATASHDTGSPTGRFVAGNSLQDDNWLYPAEGVMVARFLAERTSQRFGLYIGDSDVGEIHHEPNI